MSIRALWFLIRGVLCEGKQLNGRRKAHEIQALFLSSIKYCRVALPPRTSTTTGTSCMDLQVDPLPDRDRAEEELVVGQD